MSNVAHASLSGSSLHEPKGVGSATSGQVYIADGLGSGAWSSASNALSFVGQIADFCTPVAPSGWLECDGATPLRADQPALFTAMTIQQTGTRTNSSAVVTGLSSTANMFAGYFVGGTGITNGTTILTVDSATQITMSAAASSSGSATVIISPFAQGNGSTTFTLPDTKTGARYRRSRDTNVRVGQALAGQNAAHTHTGTTSIEDATHTHSGATGNDSPDHTHAGGDLFDAETHSTVNAAVGGPTAITQIVNSTGSGNTGGVNGNHAHTFTSGNQSTNHHHTFTSDSSGSAEVRPITLVVMTCIRT